MKRTALSKDTKGCFVDKMVWDKVNWQATNAEISKTLGVTVPAVIYQRKKHESNHALLVEARDRAVQLEEVTMLWLLFWM